MTSLFQGAKHAKAYALYRPHFPAAVFEDIVSYCKSVGNKQGLAVDGQGTRLGQAVDGQGNNLRLAVDGQGNNLRLAVDGQGSRLGLAVDGQGNNLRLAVDGQGNRLGLAVDGQGNNLRLAVDGQGNNLRLAVDGQGSRLGLAVDGQGNNLRLAVDGQGNRLGLAVDVGCGSGQSTLPLAPHFSRVIGIDPSRSQISQATTDQSQISQATTDQSQISQATTDQSQISQASTYQSQISQAGTDQSQISQAGTDQSQISQAGTDQSQISQAGTVHENVEFREGQGEDLAEFSPGSVDLVCAFQALHWFDTERFYPEVCRVLAPGGVLAACGYGNVSLDNPQATDVISKYYWKTLTDGGFWDSRRRHINTHYKDFTFPLQDFHRRESLLEKKMSLEEFVGYLTSWSAYQTYMKQNDVDPLIDIKARLCEAYKCKDAKETEIVASWPIFILLGHKGT